MNITDRIEQAAASMKAAKQYGANRLIASFDGLSLEELRDACTKYGAEPRIYNEKEMKADMTVDGVYVALYAPLPDVFAVPQPSALDILNSAIAAQSVAA